MELVHEAQLCHGLSRGKRVECIAGRLQVFLDRREGDAEDDCDFLSRFAACNPAQNLALFGGQSTFIRGEGQGPRLEVEGVPDRFKILLVRIPYEIDVVLRHPAGSADGGHRFLPGKGIGETCGVARSDAEARVCL